MNQYLKNDTLFTSPLGKPITELRDAENKLILFTESFEVYKQFHDWKYCIFVAPYCQGTKDIGYDLHFDKQAKDALLRVLKKMAEQKEPESTISV